YVPAGKERFFRFLVTLKGLVVLVLLCYYFHFSFFFSSLLLGLWITLGVNVILKKRKGPSA
ncbi:MAG: hypothetical protein WC371_01935, partial [Parachlamydiales bacterium]